MEIEYHWYAIYTKPRWEKKIHAKLLTKGIDSWCPLQKIEKQWSDRKKIIEEPLFKSYVFIRINIKTEERAKVMMTDGVVNFVYFLGKPAVIKDKEVALIKHYLLEKDARIEIFSIQGFKENEMVKVNCGVFMDETGKVIRAGKKKVYVELKGLGQVMTVEFPVAFLSPAV